jgi:SAM-dependent methyltransferase
VWRRSGVVDGTNDVTQFYVDEQTPHLGGFIVGGDDATYYPQLWEWLVREHGIRSVVDVGCGEGHAARYFADLGCDVVGIDGVWQLSQNWQAVMHDYTTGPLMRIPGGFFDLAWSCEFVEHVEERYMTNYLSTFREARLILMTHADPGQPGYHHVNCQTSDYWKGVMAALGYSFDANLTRQARELASLIENPINHFARSGLAFSRRR